MVYESFLPFWSSTPLGALKGDRVPRLQAGFTLIEVLTVLAVAGILMLIASSQPSTWSA